jgi:hypothetical protein
MRLADAAPDLLAALEKVADWWTSTDDDEMPAELFDAMHAAVAKAKGTHEQS